MCGRDHHLPRSGLISLQIIPAHGYFPTFLPTTGTGNHRTDTDYDELRSVV